MFCLHVWLFTSCMLDTCRGQKASDLLEVELEMVVSYHVDAGTLAWVFCKSSNDKLSLFPS